MKPYLLMTVRSGPDRDGLYEFDLEWLADYHPGHPLGEHRTASHGQCFKADARPYADKCEQIVDLRGARQIIYRDGGFQKEG